jgi:hypothetical protein
MRKAISPGLTRRYDLFRPQAACSGTKHVAISRLETSLNRLQSVVSFLRKQAFDEAKDFEIGQQLSVRSGQSAGVVQGESMRQVKVSHCRSFSNPLKFTLGVTRESHYPSNATTIADKKAAVIQYGDVR